MGTSTPPGQEPGDAHGQWLAGFWRVWLERSAGARAVDAARQRRLGELVSHARTCSPYYRELYRTAPENVESTACLPVVTKRDLMARFDDWVCDREVTLAGVMRFLADRTRIGDRYLGRYVIWKSSGTSGEPGVFVEDEHALRIYDVLIAVQLASGDLGWRCAVGSMFKGGRAALIAATGDHFASIASWERVCRSSPGLAARGYSVMEPLGQLVRQLNAFSPAYLASYPTMLLLLAEEQRAGRLRLSPSIVWSGGEYLPLPAQQALQRAFDCPVINEYGASECLSIGFGCAQGWMHVNADWVMLEPVDADHRPVARGTTSHTVLLTNLANRVQPVIRYDLGDAVVENPEICRCGNPFPAIRVEGRRDDVVVLHGRDGQEIRMPPMALATVVEEAADVHRFQIVQRGADHLLLRLPDGHAQARLRAFHLASRALRDYLDAQGVVHPSIALAEEAPVPDARSGKLRQVVVESAAEEATAQACAPPQPPASSGRTRRAALRSQARRQAAARAGR
jgi:putative adenylate-forming enzyme